MKRNGAPQKSVNEVFVKSLKGKLLLFSLSSEEDTVLDLRNRVAVACTVDHIVLVFQSRTLQLKYWRTEGAHILHVRCFERRNAKARNQLGVSHGTCSSTSI